SSSESVEITLPTTGLSMGTNRLRVRTGQDQWTARYIVWDIENQGMYQPQDLSSYYNARVRDIFEQRYLSPRPDVPTLQLPWRGIGNWCYPLIEASIDDNGLMAVRKEQSVTYLGVPFLIKGDAKNVVFTSQWDNYPTTVEVPLQGKAEKAYLLMAGSTNPMQAEMINARVKVTYTDGEVDILDLKNPTNWWPIEQDYLDDNYAFEIPDEEIPYRIRLKTGELYKGGDLPNYTEVKGYTNRAVDGGAATILDLPLDSSKTLKSLQLVSETNDVVVGIVAVTLFAK